MKLRGTPVLRNYRCHFIIFCHYYTIFYHYHHHFLHLLHDCRQLRFPVFLLIFSVFHSRCESLFPHRWCPPPARSSFRPCPSLFPLRPCASPHLPRLVHFTVVPTYVAHRDALNTSLWIMHYLLRGAALRIDRFIDWLRRGGGAATVIGSLASSSQLEVRFVFWAPNHYGWRADEGGRRLLEGVLFGYLPLPISLHYLLLFFDRRFWEEGGGGGY